MGLSLTFQFRKDWQGGSYVPPGSQMATHMMSFKKGQYVTGEVIDSGVQDPANYIVIINTDGVIHLPFGGKSYQGDNAILESPSAPWLGQTKVATDDAGGAGNVSSKNLFGLNIGDKYVMAIIVALVILITIYFIHLVIKKNKKK